MLNNFKLSTKFTLLLSLVFISGIVISGFALSQALMQRAQNQITSKGLVLLETMNSIRSYTNTNVSPLLEPELGKKEEFISESIPSHAVREIFETLRRNQDYNNFFYKDATLNPTNSRDKADDFEAKLVARFRNDPGNKEISGFRSLFNNNEKYFYIARPFAITKESCLRCHSTPEAAPKSQIATYGSKNGFGWKLNEILGVQTIYVPAEQVLDSARRSFALVIGIFIGIFGLVILLINFLLKRNVIKPIKIMAKLAQKISDSTDSSDKPEQFDPENLAEVARRADELGQLGRVFERMAHEVYAREQSLKQQVQQLRIQIDEAKAARDVSEITETDYFQELQNKAKDFRKNRNRSKESGQ
jgi:HAMP domain-containing protein